MKRQIAISDLHGCKQTFAALLDKIGITKSDELYLLGDYVDRGPDSKGVMDTIWQMQTDGYFVKCLMGNHEQITLEDVAYERRHPHIRCGDETLLASFGTKNLCNIPNAYFEWMERLDLVCEIPGYILVHAGLDFTNPDPFENQRALTWIRDWYKDINYDWLGDRIIVHGHTPQPMSRILNQFEKLDTQRYLDIDAGAVFSKPIYGQLCAFDLTNRVLVFQERIDELV